MSRLEWRIRWLEIAEAFAIPRRERNEKQERVAAFGICNAADLLGVLDKRMWQLSRDYSCGYWWQITRECDKYRVLSALLIAEMGKREFMKLFRGIK